MKKETYLFKIPIAEIADNSAPLFLCGGISPFIRPNSSRLTVVSNSSDDESLVDSSFRFSANDSKNF